MVCVFVVCAYVHACVCVFVCLHMNHKCIERTFFFEHISSLKLVSELTKKMHFKRIKISNIFHLNFFFIKCFFFLFQGLTLENTRTPLCKYFIYLYFFYILNFRNIDECNLTINLNYYFYYICYHSINKELLIVS